MTYRIRAHLFLLLLVSFLYLVPAAPARADSSPAPHAASAYDLIDAVNQYRAQYGLAAYSISSILMGTAQAQAEYMASTGTVTHTGPGGISYPDRLIAAGYSFVFRSENIMSASPSASGWTLVTSPAWADDLHQHTMLSPDLCEVGAGVAVSGALAYYVVDAACPSGSGGSASTAVPGATSVSGGAGSGGATPVVVIPNTPKPDGSILHTVQPGETLWSIAIAYKTTINDLKTKNRLASDNIYPGTVLTISFAAPTTTPAPTETLTPVPTATPFIFNTATSRPEPTVPVQSAPVAGGNGLLIVGVILAAALVAAGAITAAGARKLR